MQAKWLVGLAVALALVAFPKAGFAQVRSDAKEASESVKAEAKDWNRLLERIRPIYLKRLAEELKLDQATLDKVAQAYDSFKGKRRELHKESASVVAKIQEALARDAADSEIETLLAEYAEVTDRRHQLTASNEAEVRQILGTRGYARYVVFKKQFRRDIYKTLHEIREKGKDKG